MTATVSSHALDSVNGTDASGIEVLLMRICDGVETTVFESCTDECGRLSEIVDLQDSDPSSTYELVFETGRYWCGQAGLPPGPGVIQQVVLRFSMPNPDARYHMPLMLAPNSYSTWLSC